MQEYEGRLCPPPAGYIAIVVAKFNRTITQRLLDGALAKLRQHGVRESDIRVIWVPGAYEIPYVASYFARDATCLAVICLGAVIKGDTTHDEHINRYVSMAIGDVAERFGTPTIFGVITCNTVEQAEARSGMIESAKDKARNPAPGNKGAEAAEAALEMIDLVTELPDIEMLPDGPNLSLPSMLSQMLDGVEFDVDDDDDDDDDFPPRFMPRKKIVKKKAAKKSTKKKKK